MKMRARLNKPTCWKDILSVNYTDVRTFVNGVLHATEPGMVTGTRGTAYAYKDFTILQETGTISTFKILPMFIDEADRYQQSYMDQMAIAEYQARKTEEQIESAVLGQHGSWRDFGSTDLDNTSADSTSQITVSSSNVDDLIRAIKRKLYEHNGVELAVEKGIFIVWRAQDFELLEAFVQANGFTEADIALKNGIPVQKAFRYMGVDHYLSTSHTANHLFAGVKGVGMLGILRATYGRAKFLEDPPLSVTTNAPASGLGIVSRVDYGFSWPDSNSPYLDMVIDVNVA